jgi:hypothetical protein
MSLEDWEAEAEWWRKTVRSAVCLWVERAHLSVVDAIVIVLGDLCPPEGSSALDELRNMATEA